MSLGNQTETDILNQFLRGVAPGWAAQANWYGALYVTDPGEAGTATTNEVAYTGYARVVIPKAAGLSVSGNLAENTGLLQFPISTGGTGNATFFAIVDTASGAGQIILRAALQNPIPVTAGVQPQVAAGDFTASID